MGAATVDAAVAESTDAVRTIVDYPTQAIPQAAACHIWALIGGYLRGQIPLPVPDDLQAVGFAASLRYADLLTELKTTQVSGLDATPGTLRMFSGWLLHERLILDRYRRTTA